MRTPNDYGRIAYEHWRTSLPHPEQSLAWDDLRADVRDGWSGDAMAVVAAVREDCAPLVRAAHTLVDEMACRDGAAAGNRERVDAAWAALDALLNGVWAVPS